MLSKSVLLKIMVSFTLALIFSVAASLERPGLANSHVPQILVVCKTGGCQFEKIQPAIDSARPGDFVLVGTGLYKENLKIGKSIILQGVGQEFAVLRCSKKNLPIIQIDGSQPISVRIENLSVMGNGQCSGIEAAGDGLRLELEKLRIGDGLINGIALTGGGDVSLSESLITGNLTGLIITGPAQPGETGRLSIRIANTSISENSASGIRLAGALSLNLSDVVVKRNGLWGINVMSASCGDGRQSFSGAAHFAGKSVIESNNLSGQLNGRGNPGNHPFKQSPDGQVCLP